MTSLTCLLLLFLPLPLPLGMSESYLKCRNQYQGFRAVLSSKRVGRAAFSRHIQMYSKAKMSKED